MKSTRIPTVLRNQLGEEATVALAEMLDARQRDWSAEVLTLAAERFELRLVEEVSKLRVDMAQLESRLTSTFRQELHEGLASVRQEIAGTRVELLKWSFLFWVGQVAAMAGLLAFMLRAGGR